MQQPDNKKEQKQTLLQKAKDNAEYTLDSATNPDAATTYVATHHMAMQHDDNMFNAMCGPCIACCDGESCNLCGPCESCCDGANPVSFDAPAAPREQLPPIFFSPGGVGHVQMERM